MPNPINPYRNDLQKLTTKGDCHIIQLDEHMIIVKKEELVGIHTGGEVVTFYFKSFPAIITKVSAKKVIDKLGEFMKKHLVNDTEDIDLLGI